MTLLMQLILNTVQIGSVYVLFALGLTLIFGVMGVVNFAHGQFFALAALLISVILPQLRTFFDSPLIAFAVSGILAIAIVVALATALYQLAYRYYLRDMAGSFILSVGLLLLLEGVFLWLFGGVPRVVPNLLPGQISVFGAAIEYQRLFVSVFAACTTVALFVLLHHTRLGQAIRATAEDEGAAMLQGIRSGRSSLYGFLIGSLLAGVSGCLTAPMTVVSPSVGTDYLLKGFIIIIIGGLGSIPGAILGGLTIALLESVIGYFFDGTVAMIGMFCVVGAFLLLRPRGILSHANH
jgi:branched-chain amino acid transport system permease protein